MFNLRFLKNTSATGFGFKIVFVLLGFVFFNCSAFARDVNLQWDPNSESDLNHYVVYWGADSGSYSDDSGDIGLDTTYTCSLPDDGQVYYFAVTAVDDAGLESDYSNEVSTGDITNSGGSIDSSIPTADTGLSGDSADIIIIDDPNIEILPGNNPPVAIAGPDQNAKEGSLVYLDGTNSNDPDGDLLTYRWSKVSGPAVTMSGSGTVQPTFDTPYISSDGESLVFQLTVTDTGGLQSTDTCIVNIVSVNNPPTADAGPDQNVNEGTTVYLNGSNSSDPDDDLARYQWSQVSGPSVSLTYASSDKPVFDSPYINSDGESLVFQLTVTDQGGLQSTDTCIVNIVSVNNPPTASAGPDQNVNEGAFVYLDASGSSDPDGDILKYQWLQTGGTSVTLSDPASPKPDFESFLVDPDGESLTFQLTVSDMKGLKSKDECIVNILSVNNPPVAEAGSDKEVDEGAIISLDGSGSSDPDGDAVTFQWTQTEGTAVTLNDPNISQPVVTSPKDIPPGKALGFKLTVTDTGGLKSSDQVSVNVIAPSMYTLKGAWGTVYPIERHNKSWISAGFNITNWGGRINQAFGVSFYLSDDSSFDAGDIQISSETVSSMGEYETVNLTLNSIKVEGAITGKFLIGVIDDTDMIAQDDETDNNIPCEIQ